jgi:hypothetical protein
VKDILKGIAVMLSVTAGGFTVVFLPFIILWILEDIRVNKTIQEIKSFPHVSNASYMGSPSDDNPLPSRFHSYDFSVYFENGGEIHVEFLSEKGRELRDEHGNRLGKSGEADIVNVDGYEPIFLNTDITKRRRPRDFVMWSAILGVQIESIFDLVEHYNAISRHIESWTEVTRTTSSTSPRGVVIDLTHTAKIVFEEQEYYFYKERVIKLQADVEI